MRFLLLLVLLCMALSPVHAVPPKGFLEWLTQDGCETPFDRLISAILDAKVEAVRQELDRGADVNGTTASGYFPLRYAMDKDCPVEIVRLLLERGAKIDAQDPGDGKTSLHEAAFFSTEKLALLLKRGAKTEVFDKHGRTPLHEAVLHPVPDPEKVRLLLDHGAKPDVCDNMGRTPLHWAVEKKQMEMVRLLLEHKANLNMQEEEGYTVLMMAVNPFHYEANHFRRYTVEPHPDPDIVRMVLEKKPRLDVRNKDGFTAYTLALLNGHEEIGTLLEKSGASTQGAKEARLLHAVSMSQGDVNTVERLLKEGANPNAHRGGYTALVYAIMWKNHAIVRALLDSGADISREDPQGQTAFDYAIANKDYLPAFRMLLDRGFQVNKPLRGLTPLMRAAKRLNSGAVALLLERGADISAKDKEGNTPLHHAIMRSSYNVSQTRGLLELLLERGADINTRNREGKTPLMLGMEKAHRLSAQDILFLRERGAIGENTEPGKDDFEEPFENREH